MMQEDATRAVATDSDSTTDTERSEPKVAAPLVGPKTQRATAAEPSRAKGGAAWRKGAAPTGGKDQHHKKLNRQITAAADTGDFEQLLQLVNANVSSMNLINLSTAVHRTAKLALTCSSREREYYMKHSCMQRLNRALVEHITANISLKGQWTSQRSAEDRASEMRCLSIICWSCATLRFRDEGLFARVAAASKGRLGEMKPFELSNLLWAFAKLSVGGEPFFSAVAPHLLKRQHGEFSPQCLTTIAWAFGTAKVHIHSLFTSFARELAAVAPTMATQGIANTAWAFARVRRQEAVLFRALADAACRDHIITAFKPQELSNVVWAFATVGLQSPQLFARLADVLLARCWDLPPQNVANMLWAYAKLSAPCRDRVFPALLEVTMTRLDHYKPQEVSAILWAVAREIAGGASGVACMRYRALFHSVPLHFWHRLSDFTSQALACMVEAFTLADADGLPFFAEIVRESLGRLWTFEPPSLCTLLRGLALHMQQSGAIDEEHLDMLSEHVATRLSEMQPHNLMHISCSLSLLPEYLSSSCASALRQALPSTALPAQPSRHETASAAEGELMDTGISGLGDVLLLDACDDDDLLCPGVNASPAPQMSSQSERGQWQSKGAGKWGAQRKQQPECSQTSSTSSDSMSVRPPPGLESFTRPVKNMDAYGSAPPRLGTCGLSSPPSGLSRSKFFSVPSEPPMRPYVAEELPLRAYAMLEAAESSHSHQGHQGMLMVQGAPGSPAKLAYGTETHTARIDPGSFDASASSSSGSSPFWPAWSL